MTVLAAGCGMNTPGTGATTTGSASTIVTGGTATTSIPGSAATKPAPPHAVKGPWTMPNLVGSQLQQAQDAIQKLTGNPLFLTRSHDVTGKKRHQVVDSNWKVCTQNVPAGTSFTGDTVIDFGAVKNAEKC